jgi:hypothetical protein
MRAEALISVAAQARGLSKRIAEMTIFTAEAMSGAYVFGFFNTLNTTFSLQK